MLAMPRLPAVMATRCPGRTRAERLSSCEGRFHSGWHVGHTRAGKLLTNAKHTRILGHRRNGCSAAGPMLFHGGQDDVIQPVLLEHPHKVEEFLHVDRLDDVAIDLEGIALQLVLLGVRRRHDDHRDVLQALV